MIFYWLRKLIMTIRWLVIAPDEKQFVKINKNLKCPVCGHADGRLRCVEMLRSNNQTSVLCQHTCNVCGARFYEIPVAKVDSSIVQHSIPRNKLEREEDSATSRGGVLKDVVRGTNG